MEHESIDLLKFQRSFPDESSCLDFLFRLRWPQGFSCPRCGGRIHSFIRTRRLYQCRACRYQASVTAGTVFHKTRTPIAKWFWMIFMMSRQKSGVSILRMQELLGIGSYRTAWLMGHKIRKAMEERDSSRKLAGLLEMGDTTLNPEKSDKHSRSKRSAVKLVVGVERQGRQAGLCAMKIVERVSSDSLVALAKEKIEAGSEVRTSSLHAYETLRNEGYDQRSVAKRRDARFGRKLRWVHTLIENIKGNIRGVHHGVSKKHLTRYVAEFCYRFNRRRQDPELFSRAVTACLRALTVTWAELTI